MSSLLGKIYNLKVLQSEIFIRGIGGHIDAAENINVLR